MFYCLNEQYLLRGWDKLPTGIVDKESGQVFFLDPGFYQKLRDHSWMLSKGNPFLTAPEKEALDLFVQEGVCYLSERSMKLTGEQEYRLYPNRYLRAVHWAITGRCNCRCRHCYLSAPSGQIGEYSLKECLDIIRQMEEAGIREVCLTGGEALVHRDFREIIRALTSAGIRIDTIMSNGLMVGEDLLTFLAELGQKPEFNMSFDGIGQHDWLRGVDGAEEAVIKAFRLCKEYGFSTGSEYCLHKGNVRVLPESIKLLADLGCRSVKVNSLVDEGEASAIRDYILTTEEEFQIYLDYLPRFFDEGMPVNLMLSGLFHNRKGSCSIPFVKMPEDADCKNYCLCGHARNWMHITADGFIVPCIPIGTVECGRSHFPNLKDTTLTEALSDSVYMEFIDTRLSEYFGIHPECEACEYRNRCAGGCRGSAAYTGDLMAKDPKACTFFRGGWYEKTRQLLG